MTDDVELPDDIEPTDEEVAAVAAVLADPAYLEPPADDPAAGMDLDDPTLNGE